MRSLSRRRLLLDGAALSALASFGWRPSMARAAQGERKFLFFYAGGAWDPAAVFDPHHGSDGVDHQQDSYTRELGALRHTANDLEMEAVGRFFTRWGNRAAIVNGIDAHTVGHDTGMQMTMTGTSADNYPDWPTVLASKGRGEYPLPHVVFGGPSYGGHLSGAVVRAGGGTLLDLIDGSIVGTADRPAPRLAEPSERVLDAYVYDRVAKFSGKHAVRPGLTRQRTSAMLDNFDRTVEIEGRRFEAGLGALENSMLDQAIKATELMRLGLSRTAMVSIPGGWDTHGGNDPQELQFNDFFEALDSLMEHLASTPGTSAPFMIDEVVIVALSEFGRTPKFNGSMGKDHWPYNSSLVIGSGVRGGRSLGATDGALVGRKVDFRTGLASDTGEVLGSEHVGAALLKLGGVNPADILPGVQSFDALLRDSAR
ncbi:MAG: DUF1501 domain-containing protein [Deltaproteobacteria bacterium]|jgi:hypothetical protein|nr:DUF1501 domain-containing protein [Deltaproteobacteria bacterium]